MGLSLAAPRAPAHVRHHRNLRCGRKASLVAGTANRKLSRNELAEPLHEGMLANEQLLLAALESIMMSAPQEHLHFNCTAPIERAPQQNCTR